MLGATARNRPMHESRPTRAPEVIASLDALASALSGLEPELERWRGTGIHDAAERERARRAALHLRTKASRIVALLDTAPAEWPPTAWHGQERRGPNRATNVSRLPDRPAPGRERGPLGQEGWEPFRTTTHDKDPS